MKRYEKWKTQSKNHKKRERKNEENIKKEIKLKENWKKDAEKMYLFKILKNAYITFLKKNPKMLDSEEKTLKKLLKCRQ